MVDVVNEKGSAPLLLLVAVIGILGFLIISNTFVFKNNLFATLFPKLFSHAASTWDIRSVDMMSETKDVMCNEPSDALIAEEASKAAELHANYVAISMPLDNPTCNGTVVDSTAFAKRWVAAIRANGMHVWFRRPMLAFEGIYNTTKDPNADYISLFSNYIRSNPELFQPGDIITPQPEPQNGGISGYESCSNNGQNVCIFPDRATFNAWIRNAMMAANQAVSDIGLAGQVKVGYWGFDGFLAWGDANGYWAGQCGGLEAATVSSMDNITIDHYPESVGETMAQGLQALEKCWPNKPIVIGEYGTITTGTDIATQIQNSVGDAAADPNVIGFNYWRMGPAGNESLINPDFTNRANFAPLQSFYIQKSTPSPTPTPVPTPTPTPAPPATVLNNPWHLVMSGTNSSVEANQAVSSGILNGENFLQLTYDLHGLCALSGDASAIIFTVNNSWYYVSLSNYGQNCLNGAQTVTIALNNFKNGSGEVLNNTMSVGAFHARFWNSTPFTVDVTSAVLYPGLDALPTPTPTASPVPSPTATPTPTPTPTPTATPTPTPTPTATPTPTPTPTATPTPTPTSTPTPAPSPQAFTLEAENMTLTGLASIFSDVTASGGKAVLLPTSGILTGNLTTTAGTSQVVVSAKGDECFGWPNMTVTVGGKIVFNNTAVSSASWSNYTSSLPASAGQYPVLISFTNDFWFFCDRNLRVDTVTLK